MKDYESFEGVYEDHVDMVYNLCLNYLQNKEEAEEACQDVFLKVHEKWEIFSGKSSAKTYICRISINQCLDVIKARKRQKRFGFHIPLFFTNNEENVREFELPDFNHPGIQLEDKEAIFLLFRKINRLPDSQKTALILKTIDGESIQQISEVMKTSTKAVESLLSRARANLKAMEAE
jgi:RNA polymerase sigma factor (sigma-70 family)